jgi:toxin ParE1/3/4
MRIQLRKSVDREIALAFGHYLSKAGGKVAGSFLDQIGAALLHIETFPRAGSPKYQHLCPEMETRFWLVKNFPYAIFYVVEADYVDIIAVLHLHSDINASLLDFSSNF